MVGAWGWGCMCELGAGMDFSGITQEDVSRGQLLT